MSAQPQKVEVSEEQKQHAQHVYFEIIRTSNYFLHNCKTFSIQLLAKENPSYAQIAEIMRRLAAVLFILASDFDPMMYQKAVEYADLMTKMGVAITNHDNVGLSKLVAELEAKPGL